MFRPRRCRDLCAQPPIRRDLNPCEADIRVHAQLTKAGKRLGLRVLDHLIVSRKGRLSLKEAGLITG